MIEVGAAMRDITNAVGRTVQGATTNQRAESVRDPLEAGVLAIRRGGVAVVIVSCDLAVVERDIADAARQRAAEAVGLRSEQVLIAATHTHTGPSVIPSNRRVGRDEAYLAQLTQWIAETVKEAWASLQPARLRIAGGRLALGYNRRCCFSDGTHAMGREPHKAFTGIEGPEDDLHTAVLAETLAGEPIALVHTNSAHPVNFYGRPFYSADYPGEARKLIRESLGDIPVLYLNGPFGDLNPWPIDRAGIDNERNARSMGARAAGESLRLIQSTPPCEDLPLTHRCAVLDVPVRLPAPETLAQARATVSRFDAGQLDDMRAWDLLWAHGQVLLAERFGDTATDRVEINVLRLGDWALATHPGELYCQFGIDLRRRSPARWTAIADATNGFVGYIPTYASVLGGGYSGDPIYWTRLAPEAGYRIVDEAARMLWEAFGS